MLSLTHVCMWSGKGWKRITTEEATRLHPGGTVSAQSGLFMCELCGQYVLLTDGKVQTRHFRHSSNEKSKDCPERTVSTRVTYGYLQGEHELPIRITNITSDSFSLEMGFIQVPHHLLPSQLRINIKPSRQTLKSFVYTKERLSANGISYLSIGDAPCEYYSVEITGASNAIYQFWPKTVSGIDSAGTMFDASTGKKLVYDADVTVGKKYYLLQRGSTCFTYNSHVTYKKISQQTISWETWFVYEVTANDYDEMSARFFLDYHCRLTERPISIQPVWPVYVENPYVIEHNQNSIVMHLTGNAPTTQVFPYAPVRRYECEKGSVIEINCNSRQQLISAGRTRALQYTYFWKVPLSQTTAKPIVSVTDLHGTPIESGERHQLPDYGGLRITAPYDGVLTIRQGALIIEKRQLSANIPLVVDDIGWNTELVICVGLDVVWEARFRQVSNERILHDSVDETVLLRKLESYAGPQVTISHTIGCLASRLSAYPKIRKWLYRCIRSGHMSAQAYRELQRFVRLSESINQEERGESV